MKNSVYFIFVGLLLSVASCMSHQDRLRKQFGVTNEDSIVNITEQLCIKDSCMTIKLEHLDPTKLAVTKLEDIFDTLHYINLETADDFIVGEISKIDILKDTIYILDRKTKSIYTFTINGKKVRRIGQIGNGPGEYSEPTSMSVTNDHIFVYDQWQQKVVKYNHYGDVISDHKLPFFCQKVLMLENEDMLCFGAGMDNHHLSKIVNYCFWQCDSSYSKISKVGLFSENSKTIINGDIPLEHYNGYYYYYHFKTNDFYQILPDGNINHLVHFEFNPEYSDEFYTNIDYMFKEIEENNAMTISSVFETDKHLIYGVLGYGWVHCFFYNKLDKTCRDITIANQIKSNLTRVLPFYSPLYVQGDCIVFNYNVSNLIKRYKKTMDEYPDLWAGAPDHVREFDKKLLESLHEEDNDILVFAKIKEHFD